MHTHSDEPSFCDVCRASSDSVCTAYGHTRRVHCTYGILQHRLIEQPVRAPLDAQYECISRPLHARVTLEKRVMPSASRVAWVGHKISLVPKWQRQRHNWTLLAQGMLSSKNMQVAGNPSKTPKYFPKRCKVQSKRFFTFPPAHPPGSNHETILLGNPNGLSRCLNQEGYGSREARGF